MIIGFLAQGFFSARILVQWILSERARRVLSPSIFWILSLCGSYLLFIYGWLRDDFAIVLGQLIAYYIYIYNLKLKGVWSKLHIILKGVLLFTPIAALCFVAVNAAEVAAKFFQNDEVPMWLLLYGSSGQVLFTLRFVYQWIYSSRQGESELPPGFWWLSLAGSACIVSYGIIRLDWVLIIGQSFGVVSYSRNLWIGYRNRRNADNNATVTESIHKA